MNGHRCCGHLKAQCGIPAVGLLRDRTRLDDRALWQWTVHLHPDPTELWEVEVTVPDVIVAIRADQTPIAVASLEARKAGLDLFPGLPFSASTEEVLEGAIKPQKRVLKNVGWYPLYSVNAARSSVNSFCCWG